MAIDVKTVKKGDVLWHVTAEYYCDQVSRVVVKAAFGQDHVNCTGSHTHGTRLRATELFPSELAAHEGLLEIFKRKKADLEAGLAVINEKIKAQEATVGVKRLGHE